MLFLATLGAAQGSARNTPRAPTPHNERTTRALAGAYESAEHWALRAIVLLTLDAHWHPVGAECVLGALRGKDKRLQVFAIEALLRTRDDVLRSVAARELVSELVSQQANTKNPYARQQIQEVLARLALTPEAKERSASEWQSLWSRVQPTYAPQAWPEIESEARASGPGTVTQTIVERAFDLSHAGLDVAICIDCTGSMQATIDTARAALDDLIALLRGISPKLRLGVVQYRDFGDMREGARIEMPLTTKVEEAREQLGHLVAGGGGDVPERVEKGLELSLSKEMGWLRTANKLVVVIGDAPPHPEALDACLALAKLAHEQPLAVGGKPGAPLTGPKKDVKLPTYVISTLGVGANPDTARTFKAIAEAGGGAYGRIDVRNKGADAEASRRILEHILVLSFGARWEREMKDFVEIFFRYRREGCFK